jgi:hypothetical protein
VTPCLEQPWLSHGYLKSGRPLPRAWQVGIHNRRIDHSPSILHNSHQAGAFMETSRRDRALRRRTCTMAGRGQQRQVTHCSRDQWLQKVTFLSASTRRRGMGCSWPMREVSLTSIRLLCMAGPQPPGHCRLRQCVRRTTRGAPEGRAWVRRWHQGCDWAGRVRKRGQRHPGQPGQDGAAAEHQTNPSGPEWTSMQHIAHKKTLVEGIW